MMKSRMFIARTQRGFTLVEAIIVMVLTGILAGTMMLFLRQPVQNYVDAAARADLSDTADLALRRMARELRGALPNSIRALFVNGVWYVQFIPVKAGGQYLAVEDGAANGIPLDFVGGGDKFNVVGPMPAGAAIIPGTDSIVIYNLGNEIAGADAYAQTNLAVIKAVNNTPLGWEITLNNNPYAVGPSGAPNASPEHRFSVVTRPVTFRCEGRADGQGTLVRIVEGGFTAVQLPSTITPATPRLAANVLACNFSVDQAANVNAGMVGMSLALARPRTGGAANGLETVTLVHQIHVDNTP
ncbi:prepilin-type N-terminal cleavage/methylation domain-containing protein [Duganella sp. BuS-21]|uniref:prepilin-type N-terminal cleavage/methylation domain-containing protein n=1 Tax=Duganella sp. BuS-21 TaxID=2943848 RepID=UPI0035A68A84